jgi:hypothetical protein
MPKLDNQNPTVHGGSIKFGSQIFVHRGSLEATGGSERAGMSRLVRCRLLFVRGNQILVELLENDKFAVYPPFKIGEKGWFSKGSIDPNVWSV